MISREAPSYFSRSWNRRELQYSWNTRMILMTTDSCSGLAPTESEFSNHACWHSLFLLQYVQSSLVICFWSESELFSCYWWLALSSGYTCSNFVRLTSIWTDRFWLNITANYCPTKLYCKRVYDIPCQIRFILSLVSELVRRVSGWTQPDMV